VDVAKLFDELPIVANVEIVVPLLPEVLGIADQSSRHSLLQRLERFRERRTLRFADEQMNVLRHHNIAVDAKPETSPDAFERGLERTLRRRRGERRSAMVAAERHKMSLPGFVETLQFPRHVASLAPRTAPLKQKKLEWATRELPHSSQQKA
jgi:hypothetical protein